MELLKSLTGKVVAGVMALVVVVGGITWWQMGPERREVILSGTGYVLLWLGIVLLAPWATFFASTRVAKFESNAAGAALVAGYTLVELLILAWLFDWSIGGAAAWTFLVLGGLLAAVYNLFTCDWIAEKLA